MCELESTHMNTETKTKYKRYDEAFKKSAVKHWLLSGKSARQVANHRRRVSPEAACRS